jgi:hypothetical protein
MCNVRICYCLHQCFPTGVPRNLRVPWACAKGSVRNLRKYKLISNILIWTMIWLDYEHRTQHRTGIDTFPDMRCIVCSISAHTKTKNKLRNQLNAASDLQISFSGITPDLKIVMKILWKYSNLLIEYILEVMRDKY